MSYVRKTFTCPKIIWDEFQIYLDAHPEISYSGLLQKFIRNFTAENTVQEISSHVQNHTQSQTN